MNAGAAAAEMLSRSARMLGIVAVEDMLDLLKSC
jgi:hypothetical protein